jgi:DNA-binding NarL/FixJ family response regulator
MRQVKTRKPRKRIRKASTVRHRARRIFIVENHPATRAALVTLINQESDLAVCGKAANANRALAALSKLKPDLVVTDLNMPGKSGLNLIRDLKQLYPEVPVIVISVHEAVSHAERALRAGAEAYVSKSDGGEKLVAAIHWVLGS